MNATVILDWIKANVLIVVFIVVMIAAPIAMFIVTGGMNKDVEKEVATRAALMNKLRSLENTDLRTPDGTVVGRGVVNDKFIEHYEQQSKVLAADAASVQQAAVEHNRKGRGVVMEGVFPTFPEYERDVIPRRFHDAVMSAYQGLLQEVRAGAPPDLESLRQELEQRRNLFIAQDLKKDPSDPLEAEERTRLTETLAATRLALYDDAATRIGLYVTPEAINAPQYDHRSPPTLGQMFNWQWQFWVTQDILKALNVVNQGSTSVQNAPVKRVVSLIVHPPTSAAAPTSTGGSDSGSGRMGGGFGAGGMAGETIGGGGMAGAADGAAEAAAPPDSAARSRDYRMSFTGLTANSLFDVVYADLALVVETAKLPQVLDELSRYNFMTIIDLRVTPTNAFEAAGGGYMYGAEPVSTVILRLETVWLREWITPFMPEETKSALGMPTQNAAAPPAGDA